MLPTNEEDYWLERDGDRPCTVQDACREYALIVGQEHPDRAWIVTDYDTWEPNPFYHGPAVRHPEDDEGLYEAPVGRPTYWVDAAPDDDCPF